MPPSRACLFTGTGTGAAAEFGPAAPDYDFFGRWTSGGVFAVFAALIIGVSP